MDRMIIRLYIIPILFLLGSLMAMYLFGDFIPAWFSQSPYLSGLAQASVNAARWIGLALLSASILSACYSSYRLWRWSKGEEDSCDNCGGLTNYKDGRYGPYYKDLACGKNRSV